MDVNAMDLAVHMGRIEAKIDQVLAILGTGGRERLSDFLHGADSHERMVLQSLTLRQHFVLQMLLNGKSNAEIAERLAVTEDTAKVHVRLIAKKAGVHKRQQIVAFFKRAFDEIPSKDYATLTRGLPKDWDARWGNGTEQYDALLRDD